MDGMHAALKQRRGGLLNDMEENAHQMPSKAKGDADEMKSLVMSLSDDQKAQLLSMLEADVSQGPSDPAMIQKGAPSTGEKIDMAEGEGAFDLGGEHESEEEIGESLISSADKMRADQGVSGRNLGERVRINLAKKQKQKG